MTGPEHTFTAPPLSRTTKYQLGALAGLTGLLLIAGVVRGDARTIAVGAVPLLLIALVPVGRRRIFTQLTADGIRYRILGRCTDVAWSDVVDIEVIGSRRSRRPRLVVRDGDDSGDDQTLDLMAPMGDDPEFDEKVAELRQAWNAVASAR